MFCKIGAFKNFTKMARKQLYWSLFLKTYMFLPQKFTAGKDYDTSVL